MGWFDRVLSWIGFEVEVADDELAATQEPRPEQGRAEQRSRRRGRSERPFQGNSAQGAVPPPVVALPGGAASMRVVIIVPRNFDDVQVVADHLKARRPVVVNLEDADRDLAQRVINFLSGTIYALSGEMHRIGPNVLFFAPGGIDVSVEGRPTHRDGRSDPTGGFSRPGE